MNTNTSTSIWKKQVSLPIAIVAIAVMIVGSLVAFEHQTGLSASIRSNPMYGSLPVHSAAPTAIIRRTANTSSVRTMTPNAKKRLRSRAKQHQAAQRSSAR